MISYSDQGDIAVALVHIFHNSGQLLSLLRFAIEMEVENTGKFFHGKIVGHTSFDICDWVTYMHFHPSGLESLLFRDESLGSRMMSVFSKLVGRNFVYQTLHNLILEVMQPDFDLEVCV